MQLSADEPSSDSGAVTRSDLADAVRRRAGLSRGESADHVDAVLTEIIDVIVSGESLKLHSFGSFHVRSKNERPGRNPKTGNRRHGLGAARRDIQTLWAFPRAHQRTFVGGNAPPASTSFRDHARS